MQPAIFPIDKGTDNKNIVTNFRPFNVLRTFSGIYELTIKNQLLTHLDKVFSTLISQVTVRIRILGTYLFEEWKEHLNNVYVVGGE